MPKQIGTPFALKHIFDTITKIDVTPYATRVYVKIGGTKGGFFVLSRKSYIFQENARWYKKNKRPSNRIGQFIKKEASVSTRPFCIQGSKLFLVAISNPRVTNINRISCHRLRINHNGLWLLHRIHHHRIVNYHWPYLLHNNWLRLNNHNWFLAACPFTSIKIVSTIC